MFFVYALASSHRKYIYVGLSANLKERIRRHNHGFEKTTKPYAPFRLIYFEVVNDRPTARRREKFLKTTSGKRFLRSINDKYA